MSTTKLYRNIAILTAVLLALIGAFFLVKYKLSSDEAEDYKQIEIYKLDKEKVVEVTVINGEDTFVFKKSETGNDTASDTEDDDNWELVSGGDFTINQVRVRSIVANICDLYATKEVEDNPKNLAQYGLDNPVTVTVKLSDGTTAQIEVGDATPTASGFYVREASKNKVYTISYYAGDMLKADENGLRNKFILDVTSQEVTELAVTKNGKRTFKTVKSDEKGWYMVEPIEASINMVRLTSALDALVRAEVVDYVEKNVKDLAKYGLDNPSYIVEAAAGSQRVTLLIGDVKENNAESYGMFEGTDEVFTINPGTLGFLDTPALEIIDGFIYAPYIYTINDLDFNIDGKTIKLKIEEVKNEAKAENTEQSEESEDKVDKQYKYYIDGIDVEAKKGEDGVSKFRNFYASIISITASEIEPETTPSGDAEISVVFNHNNEAGKVTVEFIPRDERTYYAMKNGKYTGIVVRKDAFNAEDGPRKTYEELMNFLNSEE
ncbi:MAG TPA: DUF4340 domain-containing protein [Acetivibrio sp.]|uniref:DUF4340 domain-containing protein n=1 Tax=Acetivibrio sp. TaxID=1872092 RepID=UPI002CE3070B|nr:DUF4340 domain-containing protein [Acetivibrio sp.]HOM02302.1 DUF4340 domain-containing protein [Acetivibrio sp.]